MRYHQGQMQKLVNQEPQLKKELNEIKSSMSLENEYALKALYHAAVKDGGYFQKMYQELDVEFIKHTPKHPPKQK